jgi:predicted dehydrogenase
VLGTANIAARAFLPALRAAGGEAAVVGSRRPDTARGWGEAHAVGAVTDYDGVLSSDVDAVYIALPNDLHIEWATKAAQVGKAVLCEKPLGLSGDGVRDLVAATAANRFVWEAFVFAFHPQTEVLINTLAGGVLGQLLQVSSEFHFRLSRPDNIRWQAERGGGAQLDVGCYPIRLARLLFDDEPTDARAVGFTGSSDVDIDVAGALEFPDERRLIFAAGFRRGPSTHTRLIGAEAELHVDNPFHPTGSDSVRLWRNEAFVQQWDNSAATAFEHAIRHIHDALAGRVEPRHSIAADSTGQARAVELVRQRMAS